MLLVISLFVEYHMRQLIGADEDIIDIDTRLATLKNKSRTSIQRGKSSETLLRGGSKKTLRFEDQPKYEEPRVEDLFVLVMTLLLGSHLLQWLPAHERKQLTCTRLPSAVSR
jgi:hypothetical protein